jgi:hypothetical protein
MLFFETINYNNKSIFSSHNIKQKNYYVLFLYYANNIY